MTNATPLMGPIHGVSNWTGGSFSSLAALGYNASKTTATQLGLRFSLAVLPNHATMGILMLGRGWELGYHLCTPPPLGRRAAWSVASTQCTVGIKEQHLTIVVFCLSSSHLSNWKLHSDLSNSAAERIDVPWGSLREDRAHPLEPC